MQTCFAETNRRVWPSSATILFLTAATMIGPTGESCARANFVGVLISFFGENIAGHFKTDPKVPQRALCVISTSKWRLAASFVRGKIAVLENAERRWRIADHPLPAPSERGNERTLV